MKHKVIVIITAILLLNIVTGYAQNPVDTTHVAVVNWEIYATDTFDVHTYDRGIYIYQVTMSGRVQTGKIVIE